MSTDPLPVLRLPPAPPLQPRDGGGLLLALPALGGVGSVALVATSGLAGSGPLRTRSLVAAGLFLLVTVAFVVLQVERQRRQRQLHGGLSRDDHHRHLAAARTRANDAARAQRAAAARHHPDPLDLVTAPLLARTDLVVRIGVGEGPPALRLDVPEPSPAQPPDVASQRALDRFIRAHGQVSGLPMTLDLASIHELTVSGPADEAAAWVRALTCSVVVGRTPGQLRVAVVGDPDHVASWTWLKWLPHHGSAIATDAVGPARLVASSGAALKPLLTDRGHLLLLDLRGEDRSAAAGPSATVVRLGGRAGNAGGPAVELDGSTARFRPLPQATPVEFVPDQCDVGTAEACARRQAGRPAQASQTDNLATLLRQSEGHTPLRVPVGVDPDGTPVHVDLREAAAGGHGPHGLVIGATGSGKSEFLRTVVTAMALTSSPEQLNLVLVDFKGGATFAGLAGLAHTSAFITNLADDLGLVDRMHDALTGELVRRQQLLRDAGCAAIAELPEEAVPPPALLVVIDEFTELLTARPDFAELFATIGRLGRSLGVHLLLASQRLDEGRLRGLEAHLGFRIALRTFSAAESRAVIGVPDAHHLPAAPGAGLLRTGPDQLLRFQSSLVSRPTRHTASTTPLPFTAAPVGDPAAQVAETPSLLDQAVAAVTAQAGPGRRARQIWVPPLSDSPTVETLLQAVGDAGPARLPIGIVDLPAEQCHAPLTLDLTGGAGHAAVVGAPLSGRSTLLRSLAVALTATTSPAEARLVVIDLGGDLAPLASHPHLDAYADRARPAEIRALVARLVAEADHRREGSASRVPEIWLLIDGWSALRERLPDVEADLIGLAQESLSVGVHLIVSATRWADLRPTLRDAIGTRVELRLGDPFDSLHGRQVARAVPQKPGHGLTPDGHHFLAAVPALSAPGRPT